ncbi:translocation protein Sec66 [Spiromyces aspiralis]|uniref:Translocation protein Sec66 n=1 Tax=Spiromyces aspiralis TaxID=68401 RepID=A0ACC1HXF4_9FUNG|nr:translocation protein Sec66 [Spiromyces aspiralis]
MAAGSSMLFVYLAGWAVVFGTFVHYYHKRKARALSKIEAWFPEHKERSLYYNLKALRESTPEAVPDSALKAALLRRAMTDVIRALEIQTNKQPLTELVKSGAIAEELLHQFSAAEKELDAEMLDLLQEAESLQPGWRKIIIPLAAEITSNIRQRELREEMSRICHESLKCQEATKDANREIMAKAEKQREEERERIINELIQEDEKMTAKSRKHKQPKKHGTVKV